MRRRPFIPWLLARADSDCPLGDLARDVAADPDIRGDESPAALRRHMTRLGASSEALAALDQAESRWSA